MGKLVPFLHGGEDLHFLQFRLSRFLPPNSFKGGKLSFLGLFSDTAMLYHTESSSVKRYCIGMPLNNVRWRNKFVSDAI